MTALTRTALFRYVFPFNTEGRFDILMFARNAAVYLRRNLFVVGVIVLLQGPLIGIPSWSMQMPQTWWQIAYMLSIFPFGTMATIAVCILLDPSLPKNRKRD